MDPRIAPFRGGQSFCTVRFQPRATFFALLQQQYTTLSLLLSSSVPSSAFAGRLVSQALRTRVLFENNCRTTVLCAWCGDGRSLI